MLLTPRRAAVKNISVDHGDFHISKTEQFRPHSIPPGSINFLIAAVQLAQQQQQETFAAVRIRRIASGFRVRWADLGWGGLLTQGLFQKSDQLIAAQVRPAAQLLLPFRLLAVGEQLIAFTLQLLQLRFQLGDLLLRFGYQALLGTGAAVGGDQGIAHIPVEIAQIREVNQLVHQRKPL